MTNLLLAAFTILTNDSPSFTNSRSYRMPPLSNNNSFVQSIPFNTNIDNSLGIRISVEKCKFDQYSNPQKIIPVETLIHGTNVVLSSNGLSVSGEIFLTAIPYKKYTLSWIPKNGVDYLIQSSQDLQVWTNIELQVKGWGVRITNIFNVVYDDKKFFRISTKNQ